MSNKLLLLVFCCLTVTIDAVRINDFKTTPTTTQTSTPTCPRNEKYECSLECWEGCDKDQCKFIKRKCTYDCYCENQETMARIDGRCQSISKCPKKECPKNSCWKLADNCSDQCGRETMTCSKLMKERCVCNEGYLMLDGTCVPEEECRSQQCQKQGRVYNECGNPCLSGCPIKGHMCPLYCLPGCYCPDGQMEVDGKCVNKETYCALRPCCRDGKVYNEYGSHCLYLCPGTGIVCKPFPQPGCWCPEGQLEVDGKCVLKEDYCPKVDCESEEV